MAGKRLLQDLDSDQENKPEKRFKSLPSLSSSVLGALITENTMKTFSSALEPVLRNVVRQEVEYGIKKFRFSRSSSFRVEAPDNKTPTLKLIFPKNLMKPIFTGSKISDVDNNALEIHLLDSSNNLVNLDRPIRLDIVPLHGDFPSDDSKWNSDEFESNIIKERDGKRPLLAGDVSVTVRNGVAVIGEIEFTDNSSWIRSRRFRIGARVSRGGSDHHGVKICEGITEAIIVRDHRGELYKKHHPPNLEDEVWRLEKIGKDGAHHKKLSSHHINTVQDFLKLSVVDLDKLRQIMGGMSDKMWEVTLKHARECILGNKLYISKGPNFFLILNPICEVMEAKINGYVLSTQEALNQHYVKDLVVREAYLKKNMVEVGERTTNEIPLLTQGDDLDQQYGTGQYHNIEVNRTYQQNGYVEERSRNNLERILNEGYITNPPGEFEICFAGSSSQNHINPF